MHNMCEALKSSQVSMMWSLYSHCDGNWRVCIIYFNLYILLTYSTLDCMLHAKQPANFVQLPTQILSNRILILLNKEMYIDSVLARYVATLRVASRDSRFASLRSDVRVRGVAHKLRFKQMQCRHEYYLNRFFQLQFSLSYKIKAGRQLWTICFRICHFGNSQHLLISKLDRS